MVILKVSIPCTEPSRVPVPFCAERRSATASSAFRVAPPLPIHDSTFSRTVWRLYGGAKGLVVWYYITRNAEA